MSNPHEFAVFERAKLDPVLAMKWPAIEKAYPGWEQWASARDFLVEWGWNAPHVVRVDNILARKPVRGTLFLSDDPSHLLYSLMDEKKQPPHPTNSQAHSHGRRFRRDQRHPSRLAASINRRTISSGLMPSASALKFVMMRCRSTGAATARTSSHET